MKPDRYNTHSSTFFFYYFGILALFLQGLSIREAILSSEPVTEMIEYTLYFIILMILVRFRYRIHRYILYISVILSMYSLRSDFIQMLAYIGGTAPFYLMDSDLVSFLNGFLFVILSIVAIGMVLEIEMKKKWKPFGSKALLAFAVLFIALSIWGELRYYSQSETLCAWYEVCDVTNTSGNGVMLFDFQQFRSILSSICLMFMLILFIPTEKIVVKLGEKNGKIKKLS